MRSDRFLRFFNAADGRQRLLQSCSGESSGALQCSVQASDDELLILMHDAIGDWWSGLDSATVATKIRENRGKRLRFDINSFGGDAFDGIAIYNAAAMHDAEVIADITGIAYSAASIIPMAADKIRIAENGTLGIHPAWLYTRGNRFALTDIAKFLETVDGQIVDTYVARTGQPLEQIKTWFVGGNNDGTVFSGKEAKSHGFADELIPLKTKTGASSGPDDALQNRLRAVANRNRAIIRQQFLNQIHQN